MSTSPGHTAFSELERPRFDRRLRAAVAACIGAAVIHAIPLFLPRKVPSVEVDLARVIPRAEHRLYLLAPLLQNEQSRPVDLRDAAVLVLPASTARAREFLAEAERRGPPSLENELLRARICQAEKDTSCVAAAFARARELGPADPRPDILQSELAERSGDVKGSLDALSRAHDKAPRDADLTLKLAHALGTARRLNEADVLVASLSDRLAPALQAVERGVIRLNAGENAQAHSELAHALELDEALPTAHYFRGVALARLERTSEAEAELREADLLDPADFRALTLLCALQREDGRLDDAAVSRSMLDRRFSAHRLDYDAACPP